MRAMVVILEVVVEPGNHKVSLPRPEPNDAQTPLVTTP